LHAEERLKKLAAFEEKINMLSDENVAHEGVFLALSDVLKQHPQMPRTLLLDLISAFKQDVRQDRYKHHVEVLDYCKRSANPIGRLLLYLNNTATEDYLHASDALCTSLQLINILNDIESDWKTRHRCYVPLDDMQELGLSVEDIEKQNPITPVFQELLMGMLARIEVLLAHSTSLGHIRGRLGWEVRLVMQCAKRMIQKLKTRKNLNKRLQLSFLDWCKIICRSYMMVRRPTL
jgi:phytoene/squalene synthetase